MKTPVLTTARIILSFLAVAAAALAENQNVTLKGSVIPLAKTLTRFQMVRNALVRAESAETMEFEVMLKMRNFSELQARSAAGERIGREELSSKYLPSEADYTTVKNWLVSQGFTIARDNPSHMAVFARGTADQISKSLGVEFIRVSSDQGEFSSAANDPSLPDSIAPLVLGIGGLQPNIKLNCQKLRLQENGKINTDGFSLSTDFGPSYTPQAVRAAYNVDAAGLTGAGQEVAVIMDSFPASTDLTTFWTEFNINETMSNISEVALYTGAAPAPTAEATADVELVTAMAQQAKVRVYAITLDTAQFDLALQQIYNDLPTHPQLHQATLSGGLGEQWYTQSGQVFATQELATLASAGVTVFMSSGDGGSNPLQSTGGYSATAPEEACYPASDPSVVGVGGTTLNIDPTNGAWISETGWNTIANDFGASGGGVSTLFARPAWQTGTGVPAGTMRLVPDVSMIANWDQGVMISFNGFVTAGYGGTSVASPMWAGLCALINQSRAANGLGPVGLLTPYLYPLNGTTAFHDITVGSNGGYNCGPGYDMVTGLGSPNFAQLLLSTGTEILITGQPQNAVVAAGQKATFSVVTATGSSTSIPSYQWQVLSPGGTWNNLSDNTTYSGSSTSTLTVNSPPTAMDGNEYRCTVTLQSSSATSLPGMLVIANSSGSYAPHITSQPVGLTINNGQNATLRLTAIGLPATTYQWQVSANSGSTWTILTNTTPYSGTTTSTLTITAASWTMSGYEYECLASNSVQANVASSAATLTVNPTPAFSTQPSGQTVNAGGSTSFTATASGNPAPTLQWQVSTNNGNAWTNLTDTAPFTGTATGTLTITGVTAAMNGHQYRCVASNSAESNVASSPATLSVLFAPTFTSQPSSQTVMPGTNASFTVVASGNPAPTYQWQVSTDGGSSWTNLANSAPYSGTTTGTLTITSATIALSGYRYQCLVSNLEQSNVASNAVTLTVTTVAPTLITPASHEVGAGIVTYQILVNSNANWSATTNQPWVVLSRTSGSDDANILVTVAANTTGADRTATIQVNGVTHLLTQHSVNEALQDMWAFGWDTYGQLGDNVLSQRQWPSQVAANVSAVSAGNSHTLIVKTDGSLWASGLNSTGQLGDGTTIQRNAPVQILSGGVQAVAAGSDFSLIVKTDGSLWTMGDNSFGQLGDGTTTQRNAPVQILSGGVQAISAGGDHSLILKTDGSLWAMGYNYYGQLGDGTTTQRNAPVQILSGGVQAISAGQSHSLILKTDGSLWAMGWNVSGQLGDGTTTQRNAPVQILSGGVQAVAAGQYHSLILKTDGSLWAMGMNSTGQLGDGTTTQRNAPVQILASGVQAISGGTSHSLILKTDGSLWAMGMNSNGQLGDGTTTTRKSPVQILPSGVQSVSASSTFSLVVKTDGSLWDMGLDTNGQLADGTTVYRTIPVQVLLGAQAVSAGDAHSLMLKVDGSLWAMGMNSNGQLGDGTTTQRNAPVQILSGGVQAISAGQSHSLILKTDGSLWAMGMNYYGQLGDGTTTQRNAPVQILASGVQAISAGASHSLILKTDGSLWAMGYNYYGQLGDGTTNQQNAPEEILSSGVQAISAGQYHSLILKTDGSLWAMGYNSNGQLGVGTTNQRNSPVQILASGVQAIAAGGFHSLVLKTDGSLWTMGTNYYGQLGDGTTTQRNAPVQILASGVRTIAAGQNHSLILRTDGSLWAMGDNEYGQLGDGTTTQRITPELIAGNVQSIAAGGYHSLIVASGSVGVGLTFTTQPSGLTVAMGSNASFTAAASGTPAPSYQWQVSTSNGGVWTNLTEAAPYSGTATGTLTITGVTAAMNGYQYRCLASNSVQSNSASIAATLMVGTSLMLTTQPTAQTVTAGGTTTFTVAATGTPAPTYQWQVSIDGGHTWTNLVETSPYSGTAANTLTITGATAVMNGFQFRCLASNSAQSNVASDAVALAVNTEPALTTQPSSQTVTAGGTTTFTAAASGNPAPSYQWQVSADGGKTWTKLTDTAPYSGTATGTLTITGATAAMNGYQYQCLASNSAQSNVASTVAALSVVPGAASAAPGEAVISSGFTVGWTSVTGATGYRLDVSTNSTFTSFISGYQNLDVENVSSVTLSGLNASTTYYYRVRAYNGVGTGANSSTITVTTSAPVVVATPLIVTTLAGQPLTRGSIDGTGSAARFYYPSGVAADSAGNIYLADTDNHTIRKIVASTGAVTTFAGQAGSSGSADGTGSAARFNSPSGVAVDGAGNVYVADTLNNTLRRVSAAGAVSTLAGQAGVSGSVDGTGTAARFFGPQGIAIDAGSNLYLADTNNHTIRKFVPSTGVVTTLAGLSGISGSTDDLGSAARFNYPSGVTVDGAGNLYVADTDNHTIRAISSSGQVTTLAGLAGFSGGADGTGSAARFNSPSDIAVDSAGNVYVADTENSTIRQVVPSTGVVTTLAGLAGTSGSADGLGSAARFFNPAGIAVDSSGDLYVADTDNDTVRLGLLAAAPAIQTQPQSQTVTAGSNVQFSVTASGRPAVNYQWSFNGTAISGATSSSYSLSNAQSANAGVYTIAVSNVMGSKTSNAATLTVNVATPTTSVPGDPGSSGGGGGGGGAPSEWFCGALLLLAAARICQRRPKVDRPADTASA